MSVICMLPASQNGWHSGRMRLGPDHLCILVQVTHDVSHLTCADFLRAPGVQTPVIVRFSTVIHERGSPETLRDPRGFAVKFYTREGNWDLVRDSDLRGSYLNYFACAVTVPAALRLMSTLDTRHGQMWQRH